MLTVFLWQEMCVQLGPKKSVIPELLLKEHMLVPVLYNCENVQCQPTRQLMERGFFMFSMKVLQWNQFLNVEFGCSCSQGAFYSLKCADLLPDNTIEAGPVLYRTWWEITHTKSVWETTERSRCFWNWHVRLLVHVCHISWLKQMRFLHIPPVLANYRQSMWGNSGVFSEKSPCKVQI